jgi:hypothetical protein
MLFDRLRMTSAEQVGRVWCAVLRRVYDLGGIYVLNLHPERAVLCRRALDTLLTCARHQPLGVWLARCDEVAAWWQERSAFTWQIFRVGANCWRFSARCSARATILARHLEIVDAPVSAWREDEAVVAARRFAVWADRCPCVALSPATPSHVGDFVREQGYATVTCLPDEANDYALYLDLPEGLGTAREEQRSRRSALVTRIEGAPVPLVRFGLWPDAHHAALSVTGDIDSVTIQDFFLRIVEVW